jgi:hypothetical protein
MAIENIVLISNTGAESAEFQYSEKQKGAGYYRRDFPLHTAVFQVNDFKGNVKIQATLVLYPSERDWFDVNYDNGDSIESTDSTALSTTITRNFTGNFIWIRAAYRIEQGTVTEIRYSV